MYTITIAKGDAAYPREVIDRMHRPPLELYLRGADLTQLMSKSRVAIVGSRRMSAYGKQVTTLFARQLAEQGVVIISGLAYGVDACAHAATLAAGGSAIAVLPSPVEAPAPVANIGLARRIVAQGGALLSTYPAGSPNHKANFVARNELVAALSDIVLIIEATTDSGSLRTAGFANDMGVDVMAVPGNVTSPLSAGTNQLIANNKAALAPNVQAVLNRLSLQTTLPLALHRGDSPEEQTLIDLVAIGINDGQQLLEKSRLPVHVYNQTLTMLEITGKIQPLGANHWGLT